MKLTRLTYLILALLVTVGCAQKEKQEAEETVEEPASENTFDASLSDAKAVELADKVIAAHGGEETWNETRYIGWNFLGSRDLIWDKHTGLVRIDYPKEESTYIVNVKQDTGSVSIKGRLIQDEDSLKNYISRAKQIWVNDAYWLVFPFKLKDPGVHLTYIGKDTTNNGEAAEVIQLTFNEVGFTPDNKYYAYINPENHLISQWDYFSKASDSVPAISGVWSDYDNYNGLMLSSGRGDRSLGNIAVSNKLDSAAFTF
ncbi:hypothetical protein GCM10027429_05450 [Marivirga atlantica]|uniref:Lipoprotein n=1 Tax=Marivirga atlantica TaxID=1548457 RepID=A0A937AEI7_9BACT|nr:hypothetical protein [Marivirga atlantica]MBL0764154.1 hypothetical protein [Marivirga atlantica]